MPTDPDEQLRWLLHRQYDAIVHMSTLMQQFTENVDRLQHAVTVLTARLGATGGGGNVFQG